MRFSAALLTSAALVMGFSPPGQLIVAGQTVSLRLVSTSWPPFTNTPGQPRFALDLVEEALGRIGVTTTTTIVSEAQFTPSLLSGLFDGSAAAWKDAERERDLIFSHPYLENRLVLVGRSGSDVSASSLADLADKRVAIVEGYSYGEAIDRAGPVFVRSGSEQESLRSLLDGRVDYTLMDELVVHYIVSQYPKESGTRLQIGSRPLIMRELHFALARTRPDAETIVAGFNGQLRGMLADRTYHRLLRVDWIRGDVDGDGVPEYVPFTERLGPAEPQRVYALFVAPEAASAPATSGFYLGGTVYSDWASVPESYKEVDPQPPDARRSTASNFSFAW